jgi:hypothetical protein
VNKNNFIYEIDEKGTLKVYIGSPMTSHVTYTFIKRVHEIVKRQVFDEFKFKFYISWQGVRYFHAINRLTLK